MPERICKTPFDYPPGTHHEPGESFEVHEDDLRVLTAAGFIEPAEIASTLHASKPAKKSGRAAAR